MIHEEPEGERIFVNIFGGIMEVATSSPRGVSAATKQMGLQGAAVVRLEGTNVARRKMLNESGLADPGGVERCGGRREDRIVARRRSPSSQWRSWSTKGIARSSFRGSRRRRLVHARQCLEYGTQIVFRGSRRAARRDIRRQGAGVQHRRPERSPKRAPTSSLIFVPRRAADAILESADRLPFVICIHRGHPSDGNIRVRRWLKAAGGGWIRPELPRINHAGRVQDRHSCRAHPQRPGPTSVVSPPAPTLTYKRSAS